MSLARNIKPSRFKREDFERSRWVVRPEAGTAIDDLLKPSYWSLIAKEVRKFDSIVALFDDGNYFVELMVTDVDSVNKTPVWAMVVLINKIVLNNSENTEDKHNEVAEDIQHAEYLVKYRGPAAKWSVMRRSDNAVIQEGLDTKFKANDILRKTIKKLEG